MPIKKLPQSLSFDCKTFLVIFFCRQQALFHVLAAYSMYNTEVGYCQGMSEIAALLLMYLNEEVSACLPLYTKKRLSSRPKRGCQFSCYSAVILVPQLFYKTSFVLIYISMYFSPFFYIKFQISFYILPKKEKP